MEIDLNQYALIQHMSNVNHKIVKWKRLNDHSYLKKINII